MLEISIFSPKQYANNLRNFDALWAQRLRMIFVFYELDSIQHNWFSVSEKMTYHRNKWSNVYIHHVFPNLIYLEKLLFCYCRNNTVCDKLQCFKFFFDFHKSSSFWWNNNSFIKESYLYRIKRIPALNRWINHTTWLYKNY